MAIHNAKILSFPNKTIIPGLMDANVHLYLGPLLESVTRYEGRFEDLITEAAQVTLKQGLTTVFDSWGPREDLVRVRNAINKGKITASRIFLAGNIVGYGGPLTKDFLPAGQSLPASKHLINRINERWEQGVGPELVWMTPDKVREKIRDYSKKDIDFIKYASSGHAQNASQYIAFSELTQRGIIEEGHAAGITVQAHTSTVESLRMAVEAGVDMLQHCEITGTVPIPTTTIELMVEKDVACVTFARTDAALDVFVEGLQGSMYEEHAAGVTIRDQNTRNMLKGGVNLLLGTDAGLFGADLSDMLTDGKDVLGKLGEGHFHWLEAMTEKGMKPMDVLMAATSNIAKAYKVDKDIGTLEVGKKADLLILDGNPLEDVQAYRKIHMIIKDGKLVNRDKLPEHPILTLDVLEKDQPYFDYD
jgi:imidazolonepropionase-like amidohydrolase